MIEILLLLTFLGAVAASRKQMGLANPFQIYFFVWFFLFLGYYLFSASFIKVAPEFWLLMITAKTLALLFLVAVRTKYAVKGRLQVPAVFAADDNHRILIAQVIVLLAVPLAYMKATSLAGGADIFSVIGYVQLRAALTHDGEKFGIYGYISVLSYILSSITVMLFRSSKVGRLRLVISLSITLFYAYLSTGRTGVLLSLLLILIPLIIMGEVKLKGIIVSILLIASLFIFLAGMATKGVSVESSIADNVRSFVENIRSYTVAPLLALSEYINSNYSAELGKNSFRTFIAAAYTLRLTDVAPVALVRDYVFVPDPTNVYTVYEAYVRDFSYLGFIIPPLFLIAHWAIYKRARSFGDIWIFYYAASVYPLVMQFFQDQYFSLLSAWIQIGFWYWFLMRSNKSKRLVEAKARHA